MQSDAIIPSGVCVFDWETSSMNKGTEYVGKPSENGKSGGPSPLHPRNRGVCVGWSLDGKYSEAYVWESKTPEFWAGAELLVGHNIRFDLMYTQKADPEFLDWFWESECQIWDTQLAEYLLSAQTCIQPSLAECCKRHGLEGKIDEVSDMFKQGIQAQDIHKETLLEYMQQDVMQTEQVFRRQYAKAIELGMLSLIESQMQALVATFEMQKNGMHFEYDVAQKHAARLREAQKSLVAGILGHYSASHPEYPAQDIKVGSADFLSRCLFGGTYKYKIPVPTGQIYKSGKRKGQAATRLEEQHADVQGALQDIELPASLLRPVKKHGFYEVNDDVLSKCLKQPNVPKKARELMQLVQDYRANTKDLETYYVGFSDLAWPRIEGSEQKFYVHGNFNHCITITGRLSSSKPNLQNLSGKERD